MLVWLRAFVSNRLLPDEVVVEAGAVLYEEKAEASPVLQVRFDTLRQWQVCA